MKYLPVAIEDGSDMEARGYMLIAANMAGTALSRTRPVG